MTGLATASLALGAAASAFGAACVASPAHAREALRAFPRNKPAAWVLTGICLTWAAALLLDANLGRFENLKPLVYIAAPVLFFLVVRHVDDLLAARALGGLLILVPEPVLAASRMHDSPWRITVVVFAYALAVAGIALVLNPYQFRLRAAFWIAGHSRCRALGAIAGAVGAVLLVLGLAVY